MKNPVRAEFIISGTVQGVGFRYFVYSKAKLLGLSGYTQNLFDGTVRTIAEGGKRSVDELHNYLKQGPTMSYVDKVQADYYDYTGEFSDFTIR